VAGLAGGEVYEAARRRLGPFLVWTSAALEPRRLRAEGFEVHSFSELRRRYIDIARRTGTIRTALDNPAQPLLDLFENRERVAIVGVASATVEDLRIAYGMLVEPAFRRDCSLIIQADRDLDDLRPERYVESELGHAATLEKLRHMAERYSLRIGAHGDPPMTPIEVDLLSALRERGLRPVPQFGISRMRVDFAFPESGLVVEADGREWHDRLRDARRDAVLHDLGWVVARFTGAQINRNAADVAAEVDRILSDLHADETRVSPLMEVEPDRPAAWWRRLLASVRSALRFGSHHAAERAHDPVVPAARLGVRDLDTDQERAIRAADGVVQVIAPAGSGKTTVLIERVRELRARGIPGERILCTTFNRKAADDIRARLAVAGEHVDVLTFHGLGHRVCREERIGHGLRDLGGLSAPQWARFAAMAAETAGKDGVRLEPAEAREAVSDVKLGTLLSWEEVGERFERGTGFERTVAKLYALYEQEQTRRRRNDLDDLLVLAVRRLRDDAATRERWQRRWQYVLVDEYQDIEPAQELLIRLVAAPEDSLFCVGDEDQTLYAWRRASVERVVELDRVYPGLERIALAHNYRGPAEVVRRSRTLIEHNRRRFPKRIEPAPARADEPDGAIKGCLFDDERSAAGAVAGELVGQQRGDVVVLARTTRQLREVALACAIKGVLIDASDGVFAGEGSIGVLGAYLRVFADLTAADADAVGQIFRAPNRYLPDSEAPRIAGVLRNGGSFADAVRSGNDREAWRLQALETGARFFDVLRGERDAARFIHRLRTEGGLDRFYNDREKMTASAERVDVEDLAAAEAAAQGKSLSEYLAEYAGAQASLAGVRDRERGIELATIHGAKGREWDTVLLFGADDEHLPSHRALTESPKQRVRISLSSGRIDPERANRSSATADALEDERRLAYVAFTRTRKELQIFVTGAPSRFLSEAGLDWVVEEKA
jgi:DNA helicase-2/ATP-dependent DNA helicase PcrA